MLQIQCYPSFRKLPNSHLRGIHNKAPTERTLSGERTLHASSLEWRPRPNSHDPYYAYSLRSRRTIASTGSEAASTGEPSILCFRMRALLLCMSHCSCIRKSVEFTWLDLTTRLRSNGENAMSVNPCNEEATPSPQFDPTESRQCMGVSGEVLCLLIIPAGNRWKVVPQPTVTKSGKEGSSSPILGIPFSASCTASISEGRSPSIQQDSRSLFMPLCFICSWTGTPG